MWDAGGSVCLGAVTSSSFDSSEVRSQTCFRTHRPKVKGLQVGRSVKQYKAKERLLGRRWGTGLAWVGWIAGLS